MKVNYSLSLKLTLIVVLISIVIIFSLSYINLQQQSERDVTLTSDLSTEGVINFANSHAAIGTIENITKDYEMLNSTENLSSFFSDFLKDKNNSKILRVDINKPTEEGLAVYFSTDNSSIGYPASNFEFNNESYTNGSNSYYIIDLDNLTLTIISPINISGNTIGTYDMVMSFSLH